MKRSPSRLEVSAWAREGDEIVREWKFDDFAAAIAFVNRVADAAEEANHHPDILVHGWNKVRLSVTNHSAGGLTEPPTSSWRGRSTASADPAPQLTPPRSTPRSRTRPARLLPFGRVSR